MVWYYRLLCALAVAGQHDLAFADRGDSNFDANRCGPLALAVCLDAMQRPVSSDRIIELLPRTGDESSLADLKIAAENLGLSTLAVRWKHAPSPFAFGSTPCIIPIRLTLSAQHFIAILACDGDSVTVIDDPHPPARISIQVLRDDLCWDGTALHLGPTPESLARLLPFRSRWLQPALITALLVCLTGFLVNFRIWCLTMTSHEHIGGSRRSPVDTNASGWPHAGFTLLELLVVLAIVGLLVALIAPAVQSVRESSRRMRCSHQIRQLALAIAEYESTFHVFPPSSVPHQLANARHVLIQTLSIHARLLPYLDQSPLFYEIDARESGIGSITEPVSSALNARLLSQRVPIFECPSDAIPPGAVSYRLCMGVVPGWPSHSMRKLVVGRRDQEVTDGQSQTIIFSERLVGDRDPSHYTPSRDTAFVRTVDIRDPDEMATTCRAMTRPNSPHWSWNGGSWLFSGYGNTWYNHVSPPNSPIPDCIGNSTGASIFGWGDDSAQTARSFHSGGVNVAFGDGSARFINNQIDLRTWRALGTEAGGDVASDP